MTQESWTLFRSRYSELIPDFENFILYLEKPFPVGLRESTIHSLPYSLEEKLLRQGEFSFHKPIDQLNYFEVQGERKRWGGDLDHHLGLYFMQALSSTFAPLALSPQPDQLVLDMCAAPGGKTTHLSELMENRGLIVACEPDLYRCRVLKANLTRMGVKNCAVFEKKAQELNLAANSFDAILLDGPCSSEGTFRQDVIRGSKRRKTNYLEFRGHFRESLHMEQARLLDKAYELLKVGGQLVYSTCTYDPQENEAQVSHFLKKYTNMKLVAIDLPFKVNFQAGVTSFNGDNYHQDCIKTMRFYPHQLDSIGFYIAKFIKLS